VTQWSQVRAPPLALLWARSSHTCASVTKQYNLVWTSQGAEMHCSWEGNRRSGIALAVRHRLQWFIHLQVRSLRKGDEHPTYTPHGV